MSRGGRYSFGKALRLRRRREFLALQRSGAHRRSANMIVVAQKRTDLPPPSPTRLGIVASRKVGCAVARNRAKRLVREAFRQTRHELPGSLDVLVVTTRTAATASLEAIRAELASAVKVLGQRLAKGDG